MIIRSFSDCARGVFAAACSVSVEVGSSKESTAESKGEFPTVSRASSPDVEAVNIPSTSTLSKYGSSPLSSYPKGDFSILIYAPSVVPRLSSSMVMNVLMVMV